MRLMHYSRDPFTFTTDHEYEPCPAGPFTKPTGFWVSVEGEDDWPAFCRESMPPGRCAHAYEVTIADDARILTLSTPEDLDEFTAEFGTIDPRFGLDKHIDWPAVRNLHDGILIPTYQWSRRMALDWYYTWDAASGCVWNLDALTVAEVDAPAMNEVSA